MFQKFFAHGIMETKCLPGPEGRHVTTVFGPGLGPSLGSDHQVIFDSPNTGSRPGCSFGLAALSPGPDISSQNYFIAINLDSNSMRVELGGSPQGVFNGCFDFERLNGGLLEIDQIGDTLHPDQVAKGVLGGGLLVLIVHLALERDPTAVDLHLDLVTRHPDIPLQRV